jgi:FkbH-like protein
MNYIDFLPYYKVLEASQSLKSKIKSKRICIYTIFDFNPLILNSYINFYLTKKNFNPIILQGKFDQINQEILSIRENKKFKDIDVLIIGSDINSKLSDDENKINFYLKNILSNLKNILNISNNKKNFEIIFWNLSIFKSTLYNQKTNQQRQIKISQFNNKLFEIAKHNKNLNILDISQISNFIGINNFYDDKNYYSSKIPYTEIANNQIAFELTQLVSGLFQTPKKCLVLDLDNTLWGGILGEDGTEGIKIGNCFIGEKFKIFQKYIKYLKTRGVILAINSKNNLYDVKDFFKKNKEMILKFDDFSSVKINWKPKYENINEIAKELNISKESIVFFDDSNFEREQMKKFNPSINIIDVPKDVNFYINSIEISGFFNQKFHTKEDSKKAYQYKIFKKVKEFQSKEKNLESFLKKLSMRMEISCINKLNYARAVQLINKTNQFNLTTKRYDDNKLKELISEAGTITLMGRLIDKFGDHGIAALAIAKPKIINKNDIYVLDTFLLSCRILGREAEIALLNALINKLSNLKVNLLEAYYKKTKQNISCKNFLKNNNFLFKDNKYIFNLNKSNLKASNFIKITYVKN